MSCKACELLAAKIISQEERIQSLERQLAQIQKQLVKALNPHPGIDEVCVFCRKPATCSRNVNILGADKSQIMTLCNDCFYNRDRQLCEFMNVVIKDRVFGSVEELRLRSFIKTSLSSCIECDANFATWRMTGLNLTYNLCTECVTTMKKVEMV
jgi:hypothetical protein